MSPLRNFIRTQGIACAAINAVLNPLLAWLMNRHVATVSVLGGDGILADTAITCGVMSVLVASCVSPAVRRARETGGLAPVEDGTVEASVLARLPRTAVGLGLAIGAATAIVVGPAIAAALLAGGVTALSVAGFAMLKIVYTPVLGYAVTRWVILRQMLPARSDGSRRRRVAG
ncbi:hypothetical protein CCR97_13270 [Rhodoplanes elegans]|uniref:Uncharacterized protein n=1 Tax=Rhodoplanes elegans TaxID=29408 RepID=A0A327KAQ9_9BRAD|nr:hypothetical protein [Rhodoplanes elegans]MBK5959171.1 hypothetical protein [Rhodoplanes elegans]RAI34793.1 hypothetical protein CH338_20315 [Rhodoplanes elegans]